MIELHILPRGSGKTQRIVNNMNKNKDTIQQCIVSPTLGAQQTFNLRFETHHRFNAHTFDRCDYREYSDFYIDELFEFSKSIWSIIEMLDNQGKNIYIYGTLREGEFPKEMVQYFKKHYPEWLI